MKYKYGKVEIGMPVFMNDVAAVGTADNIRKGIHNYRRMEIENKMIHELKKTKYMVINSGKEKEAIDTRSNSRKSKRRYSSRNRYL